MLVQILELIGDPVLIVVPRRDARPKITYANAAFARLIGRTAAEVVGQSLEILGLATTEPPEFTRLIDAIDQRRATDLVFRITAAGDRSLWTEIEGRPLTDEDGSYLVHLRDVTSQQTLVRAAQRSEQRSDALSRLTSNGVYRLRVEPDCRLVLDWAAGAFARLTGYSVAEIEALGGWSSLIDPVDLRIVQRRAQRLLAGEEATAEYRIRNRSGQRRWWRDTGWPQWDESRELVVGILCAAQDITEQRRLEEQLLAQQLDRKALIGLIDGLVCEIDDTGRLRHSSGQLQGQLGGRLQSGAGHTLEELLGVDLAGAWRQHIGQIVPGWPPTAFEFSFASGAIDERYRARLCAAASATILAWVQLLSGSAGDADRPAPEARADPLLRALLDLQRCAAVLLSPDLTVLELNVPAEQLTGWQRAEVRGRPFHELMALTTEQPALLQDLARAQAGTLVTASEAWLRLPGGQEGRVVWNYDPLLGLEGEVLGIVARGDAFAPLSEPALEPAGDQPRLKAIMDNVADGIVTLDHRGEIVSFSRSAEIIFGYRAEEVIGQGVDLLVVPGTRGSGSALDRIIAAAKIPGDSSEIMARRKAGEVIPIELAVSEVRFNGDNLYILTIRDITVRRYTEETIRNLAYHDPLTGLPNRLLFNDRLNQAIERARRNQQMLAVMILDLDRFKLINDSLGLASGDHVLRAVGERLVAAVRRSDTVARLGGDDFLLLLPGVEGAESAAKVAQKILDTFSPPLRVDDQELHLGASLGITLRRPGDADPERRYRPLSGQRALPWQLPVLHHGHERDRLRALGSGNPAAQGVGARRAGRLLSTPGPSGQRRRGRRRGAGPLVP